MSSADPAAFLDQRLGLRGRVALVVGGASGLGRACAVDLGRAGMRLVLGDRDGVRLQATSDRLRDEGVEVESMELDARDAEALDELMRRCDERFGALHVLVNVVGGTFHQPFEASTAKGRDALIRANYTWLLTATQLAIPRLRAAGGGSIINIGSIEGSRAAPGYAVYAGLKAAVANFARSLAIELAPDGIRVNTIAPDLVPTEGMAALRVQEPDEVDEAAHRISIPMGRVGADTDVGGCALFLASDLSAFVTGTTLHPDGGAWASAGWLNWPDDGFRNTVPRHVVERLGGD